jgi:branched-chain amino acid transport system ATP-binding protein
VTEQAAEHLEQVGLLDRGHEPVSSLSHGERRQLEVALVLACEPRLVLFDEPTAGMSAAETARFSELVESLPAEITTVIVEHDLDVVFRLADRISVLAAGRVIAEGTAAEVRADPRVNEAYLRAGDDQEPLFFDTVTAQDVRS